MRRRQEEEQQRRLQQLQLQQLDLNQAYSSLEVSQEGGGAAEGKDHLSGHRMPSINFGSFALQDEPPCLTSPNSCVPVTTTEGG